MTDTQETKQTRWRMKEKAPSTPEDRGGNRVQMGLSIAPEEIDSWQMQTQELLGLP